MILKIILRYINIYTKCWQNKKSRSLLLIQIVMNSFARSENWYQIQLKTFTYKAILKLHISLLCSHFKNYRTHKKPHEILKAKKNMKFCEAPTDCEVLSCSVKVQYGWFSFCYNNNPILLIMDNSDSPSIVEQLSQGPGFVYNTFYWW